jgi:hypothetical protein
MSFTLNAQSNRVQSPGIQVPGREENKKINCKYTLIPSVNKTWGYDIYLQKRLFIHQPNIPGLPGNDGFKTKTDTKKVARLVIDKIKKSEMPPSVTVEEMKKIKVLL